MKCYKHVCAALECVNGAFAELAAVLERKQKKEIDKATCFGVCGCNKDSQLPSDQLEHKLTASSD